ncbi:hypothetical protein DXD51_10470 [Eubacterium sp. TM05-53]|nr:hypothetical protein DXD51_10470 [Eubacterium sp. TM05-53]
MANNELLLTALATIVTLFCPIYDQTAMYFDSKEFIKEKRSIGAIKRKKYKKNQNDEVDKKL